MQVAVVSYCLPDRRGRRHRDRHPRRRDASRATRRRPRSSSPRSSVFFTTVVGALLGFKAADKASLDVVRVYGGSRLTQLVKVRLIAALPAILNALQIAVPTAFLGAVLGEYMGATDRSVGITLIRLQGNLDSERVWVGVPAVRGRRAASGTPRSACVARLVTPWVSGRAQP